MLRKLIAVALVLFLFSACIVEAEGENAVLQNEKITEDMWSVFGTCNVSTEYVTTKNGAKETALKSTGLGKNTWSSPCVDIFSIIKKDVEKNGAGRYAISFNIMLEGEENKEYNLSLIVRSSQKTTLFNKGDGGEAGYRNGLGRVKAVTGVWKSFSTTFGVLEEDVQGEQTWKLCLDSLPKDLHTVWLNDFSIIRFSDDTSPDVRNTVCVDCTKFADTQRPKENNSPSQNLIENVTSTFEGIKKWQDTQWTSFFAGNMSIAEEGYTGACLKMETPQKTWGSPALEIFPYIKEEGQYSVSMFVKYDGEGEKNLSLILRGTKANSFIQVRDTNFFGTIDVKKVYAGEWTRMTATFTVTKEDIAQDDSWRMCFSTIQPDIKALYIDEVVLIKGSVNDLPKENESNESVEHQHHKPKEEIPPLYEGNIKKTAITTSIITFIITTLVIVIKIFLPVLIKKVKKE